MTCNYIFPMVERGKSQSRVFLVRKSGARSHKKDGQVEGQIGQGRIL